MENLEEMDWTKPVGISEYHLFTLGKTWCGHEYFLDGREVWNKKPKKKCTLCEAEYDRKLLCSTSEKPNKDLVSPTV
jgi:hypothetical protein